MTLHFHNNLREELRRVRIPPGLILPTPACVPCLWWRKGSSPSVASTPIIHSHLRKNWPCPGYQRYNNEEQKILAPEGHTVSWRKMVMHLKDHTNLNTLKVLLSWCYGIAEKGALNSAWEALNSASPKKMILTIELHLNEPVVFQGEKVERALPFFT